MLNVAGSLSNPLCLGLLQAVLEQVDYGLAVVNADTRELLFANAPARAALHPASEQDTDLWVAGGKVCARQQSNTEPLFSALISTKSGKRALLHSVAILPLATPDSAAAKASNKSPSFAPTPTPPSYALLAFPKQQRCDTTTVSLYAQERGLTGAEGQVLKQVCRGMRPQEIAVRHGVKVSTVRSQLRSIRQKTASDSVGELVANVSGLPPMARHNPQGPAWPVGRPLAMSAVDNLVTA
jgi:DNA-binding CsgD family transcriptional regulator